MKYDKDVEDAEILVWEIYGLDIFTPINFNYVEGDINEEKRNSQNTVCN